MEAEELAEPSDHLHLRDAPRIFHGARRADHHPVVIRFQPWPGRGATLNQLDDDGGLHGALDGGVQIGIGADIARIQRDGAFDIDAVVKGISDKLVHRHPHVFADARIASPHAQGIAWDAHKRAERLASGDDDASALAGITRGLPEWQRALKLQHRAARVGFDWPGPEPVIAKLHEEIEEVCIEFAACAQDPGDASAQDRLEDEIGDLLFVCANLARHARVDPGTALRRANRKFERRFRAMEALAAADGIALADLPLDAQDGYWNRAKAAEKAASP